MRRYLTLLPVLVALLAVPASAGASSAVSTGPAVGTASSDLALRFGGGGGGIGRRGFFGGSSRSRGGGLFGGRRRGLFGGRGRSRGLFSRIARALAFAYILHLLFSHGGLSILVWLILISLIVMFMRRRRQRRMAY